MTNEISIVDNKRVGILKVKYEGDTFAIFNYCREGDEKEQCYPTRERGYRNGEDGCSPSHPRESRYDRKGH